MPVGYYRKKNKSMDNLIKTKELKYKGCALFWQFTMTMIACKVTEY